jgi:hypothetical protein
MRGEKPGAKQSSLSEKDKAVFEDIQRSVIECPNYATQWEISPSVAKLILDAYNIGNRPIRERAKVYTQAMRSGAWSLTGDTIKFSSNNLLLDGQHRLQACVDSKAALRTYIVFGIDPEAFVFMDRGALRAGACAFSTSRVANANVVAAAVRWVKLIRDGRAKNRTVFEPYELLDYFHLKCSSADIQLCVKDARAFRSKRPEDNPPQGLMVAFFYIIREKQPELAEQVITAMVTGHFDTRTRPMFKAIEAIRREKSASKGRMNEVARLALLFIAWNCVVNKQAGPKALDWTFSERFPDVAGSP